MRDPYEVLGVARDASESEIKQAFRKAAMAHHPDRNPGNAEAEAAFKEVNEAYQTLSDPQKRQAFDRFGHAGPQAGPSPGFHGSFEDIFEAMFNGFGNRARQRNRDVGVVVAIPLERILSDTTIDVTAPSPQGPRTVQVTVPAGMPSGARLRVVGAGEQSRSDLPPGDLYVTVEIQPHTRFEVVGSNLVEQVTIDGFAAMLGTSLTLTGLDGQTIVVNVPAGVAYGTSLRVTGHGLPVLQQAHRGDLIVRVLVRTPRLTPAQADLVTQARDLNGDAESN